MKRTGQSTIDPATYFINDVKASDDGVQKYFVCWVNGTVSPQNGDAAIHLHVHNWTYSATGATLTATCNALGVEHGACVKAGEGSPVAVTLTRTLSVPAATKTYDGKAVTATLSEEKLWTEANGLVEPAISYYMEGKSKALPGAPKDVGTYVAKATIKEEGKDDVTVQVSFSITQLEAKLSWTTTLTYNGREQQPPATVSNLVAGDACDVTVEGRGTEVGSYQARATALSNANHRLPADPTTQFTIASSTVTYTAHVQTYGNRGPVTSGPVGTIGKGKRLESLTAKLSKGTIEYRSHVQGKGWEKTWAKYGQRSGTVRESRRVEAIQMRAPDAEGQHVWYRVHSQSYGCLGWTKDGANAGTAGLSKRVEAIEVVILPNTAAAPGSTARAFRTK